MVKKLYKHEFLAWLRVVPMIFGITLLTAAFHRVLQFFETDSVYYNIVNISGIVLYVVALLVCIAAPVVFGIVRFYKNLFTGEGYLTLTLPVRTTTHLNVKVITAAAFSVASLVVCVLSFLIITAGDVLSELWKAFLYLWNSIPPETTRHLIGYAAEFCVLLLVGIFSTALLYNSCLCIGQLAKKNRVLLAVGVYFGYYMLTQFLSTAGIILFTVLETAGMLAQIYSMVAAHPEASVHVLLCGLIVLEALLGLVFWLICRFILRKKLNLE